MRISVVVATLIVFCMPALLCAQTATFDGQGAARWARRLGEEREATITRLAAGGAASVAVLGELLGNADAEVAGSAARACAAIGAPAAPLAARLLTGLRQTDSWWLQVHCAEALAAIGATALGARAGEARAAMLHHVARSTVPRLRSECVVALARLDPQVVPHLLAAAGSGQFADASYAVDALVRLGEPAVEPLIAAVSGDAAAIARAALARFGWRAVDRLERAGLDELAKEALLTGPLQLVTFGDDYHCELEAPLPAVGRLPEVTWESGSGHGGSLALYRAVEDARGVSVDEIRLLGPKIGDPRAPEVQVRSTRLPRDLAGAAVRQLLVLGAVTLRANDPARRETARSTGDFHAAVRLVQDGKVVLDEAFCGYPAGDNVEARFRAQAAVGVMHQALAQAEWTTRAATAADRQRVERRCGLDGFGQARWVSQRLQQMRDLLAR
ncbi:MAG: hypothetical protein KDC48_09185 [Planctomycetes bacterium]|nr:hypothetical protein [Planctomycetota bacterium]